MPAMAFTLRQADRARDRAAVSAIDTSFETSSVFDAVVTPRALELRVRALPAPRTKRYSMGEAFAPWSTWDAAWVAEDGAICGFAAVEHEAWHARLVLWHLYVTRTRRREGIGRALLERAEAHGRRSARARSGSRPRR